MLKFSTCSRSSRSHWRRERGRDRRYGGVESRDDVRIETEVDHHFEGVEQCGRRILSRCVRTARRSRASASVRREPGLPRLIRYEVDEIGLAEVAVIVGLFLDAHRRGRAEVLVPVSSLLTDRGAPSNNSTDVRPQSRWRARDCATSSVLDLASRAERVTRMAHETLASMRIEPSPYVRPTRRGDQDAGSSARTCGPGRASNVRSETISTRARRSGCSPRVSDRPVMRPLPPSGRLAVSSSRWARSIDTVSRRAGRGNRRR